MQNSSQFQPRGELAWEHLPVHVVQELKPGMVIRTAESDRPRVKDPHEQDPVSRTLIGLSSSVPHILGFLWALRKKGGVVRPVSPTYVFAPKISAALRRTCHENDL